MENASVKKIEMSNTNTSKIVLLLFSLLFDLVGIATFVIPAFGEFFDIVWAPISAILIFLLYRKHYGALGAVAGFFEEILPATDVIPTFTIMWFVKYYLNKEKIG